MTASGINLAIEDNNMKMYKSLAKDNLEWLLGQRFPAYDPFMVFPLRFLGYGYAFGVGIRFRFCKNVQDSCKATAICFVICHTIYKMQFGEVLIRDSAVLSLDSFSFDFLSYLFLPTLTTYAMSRVVRSYIKNRKHHSKRLLNWGPILACMVALPIIAYPIDAFTNRVMDASIRTLYTLPKVIA